MTYQKTENQIKLLYYQNDKIILWNDIFNQIPGTSLYPIHEIKDVNLNRNDKMIIISIENENKNNEEAQNEIFANLLNEYKLHIFDKHQFKIILTDNLKIKYMLDQRVDLIGSTIIAYVNIKENLNAVEKIKHLILDFLGHDEIIKNFVKTELIEIKIRNLNLFSNCPCDFYIHLEQEKYRHYYKKKSKITKKSLQNLKEKNNYKLFLEKKDQILFFEQSLAQIKKMFNQVQNQKHYLQLNILAFLVLGQYIKEIGPNKEISDFLILLNKINMEHSYYQSNSYKIISSFPFEQKDLSEKSFFISYLLFYITSGLTWTSKQSYLKIMLASLLHDLYFDLEKFSLKSQQEPDFYSSLNQKQKSGFHHHIDKAIMVANYFSNIPETGFIIKNHHNDLISNNITQGHPLLVSLFYLINKLIEYLFVYGISKKSINEMMQYLEFKHTSSSHKNAFKILKESFTKAK